MLCKYTSSFVTDLSAPHSRDQRCGEEGIKIHPGRAVDSFPLTAWRAALYFSNTTAHYSHMAHHSYIIPTSLHSLFIKNDVIPLSRAKAWPGGGLVLNIDTVYVVLDGVVICVL